MKADYDEVRARNTTFEDLPLEWFEHFAKREEMRDEEWASLADEEERVMLPAPLREKAAKEPPLHSRPDGTWHHDEGRSAMAFFISQNPDATDAQIHAEVLAILPKMEDQSKSKLAEYTEEFTRAGRSFRKRDQLTAEKNAAHKLRLTEAMRVAKALVGAETTAEGIQEILTFRFTDLDETEISNIITTAQKYAKAVEPIVREPLKIQTAAAIRALNTGPMLWAVDQLLPSKGVVILAGKPKEGKSWLVLQCALGVSAGTKVMGRYAATKGRVLYLALEDNDRRIKERLDLLDVPGADDNLAFSYDGQLDMEGVAELEQIVEQGRYTMLIVDTFLGADRSPTAAKNADIVKRDYDRINLLKKLSERLGICTVLVCHMRKKVKGEEGGSLDSVLNTTGFTAAADLIIMLEGVGRENGKRTSKIHVTGKDVGITDPLAMTLDPVNGGWRIDGIAGATDLSTERYDVLEVIKSSGAAGVTRGEISLQLDKSKVTTSKHLKHLLDNFLIGKSGGRYHALTAEQRFDF